jgi:hypothetical protein
VHTLAHKSPCYLTSDSRLVSDGMPACAGIRLQACTERAPAQRHSCCEKPASALVARKAWVTPRAAAHFDGKYLGQGSGYCCKFQEVTPAITGLLQLFAGDESHQMAVRLLVLRRLHPALCSPMTRYGKGQAVACPLPIPLHDYIEYHATRVIIGLGDAPMDPSVPWWQMSTTVSIPNPNNRKLPPHNARAHFHHGLVCSPSPDAIRERPRTACGSQATQPKMGHAHLTLPRSRWIELCTYSWKPTLEQSGLHAAHMATHFSQDAAPRISRQMKNSTKGL